MLSFGGVRGNDMVLKIKTKWQYGIVSFLVFFFVLFLLVNIPSFPGFLGRQPGPSEVPLPGLVPNRWPTQLTPPNSLPGQHEGRGGSAFRRLPTGCQAIDKLPVTGQGTFTQLLTDDLKQENKGLQTSYSSTDDELSVLLKQLGKNSAPTLYDGFAYHMKLTVDQLGT